MVPRIAHAATAGVINHMVTNHTPYLDPSISRTWRPFALVQKRPPPKSATLDPSVTPALTRNKAVNTKIAYAAHGRVLTSMIYGVGGGTHFTTMPCNKNAPTRISIMTCIKKGDSATHESHSSNRSVWLSGTKGWA